MTTDLVHTIEEAMAILKMSRALIYTEMNAGRLHKYDVGRRRYISADAIKRYIADRERETKEKREREAREKQEQRQEVANG